MIAFRGMYICITVYIPSNWKDIRITDMNEAVPHLKAMRIACRVFLDKVEDLKRKNKWFAWYNSVRNTLSFPLRKFYMTLGELRSTFGITSYNFV